MKISAAPREVVELTLIAPGTARPASSSGSVISISICRAGMLPLSTSIRMRGKEITGNNPTGRRRPANSPASASAKATNNSERRWRSTQRTSVIAWSVAAVWRP